MAKNGFVICQEAVKAQNAYLDFFQRLKIKNWVVSVCPVEDNAIKVRISGILPGKISWRDTCAVIVQISRDGKVMGQQFTVNDRQEIISVDTDSSKPVDYSVFQRKIVDHIIEELADRIANCIERNELWTIRYDPDDPEDSLGSKKKAIILDVIEWAERGRVLRVQTPYFAFVSAFRDRIVEKVAENDSWVLQEEKEKR